MNQTNSTLKIRCAFDGDSSSDGFIVETSTMDTIAGLKDLILLHVEQSLDWNTPTDMMRLCLVSIDTAGQLVSLEMLLANNWAILLRDTTLIGQVFPALVGTDRRVNTDRIRIVAWIPPLF